MYQLNTNVYVSSSQSYGTYLSQLIRFATVCNNVEDFSDRNCIISRIFVNQSFHYHELRKTFARFNNMHFYFKINY